jgi:hypothetical protein
MIALQIALGNESLISGVVFDLQFSSTRSLLEELILLLENKTIIVSIEKNWNIEQKSANLQCYKCNPL